MWWVVVACGIRHTPRGEKRYFECEMRTLSAERAGPVGVDVRRTVHGGIIDMSAQYGPWSVSGTLVVAKAISHNISAFQTMNNRMIN